MSVGLYMDQHVDGDVTAQLRRRGVSVVTAEQDGCKTLTDPALLDRAGAAGRVLVTHDSDLLVEAARRQRLGVRFAGIVYSHPLQVTIGQLVRDLELIAAVYDPADMADRVERLPL